MHGQLAKWICGEGNNTFSTEEMETASLMWIKARSGDRGKIPGLVELW
jgi:hypothetical protein